MINSGIKNLWLAKKQQKVIQEAFTVNESSAPGSIENAMMDAPVIRVDWSPNNQDQLLYLMKFTGGMLKVSIFFFR
jgi:hypothetical protein